MRQASVRRKLQEFQDRIVALREEISILSEQIEVLDEEVEDLRIRAMVSETPISIREHAEASRHVELAHRAQERAVEQVALLEIERNILLDEIVVEVVS